MLSTIEKLLAQSIAEALRGRDRSIIGSRYAIGVKAPLTLEQVASRHDLSRQRVAQLEKRALAQLRRFGTRERTGFGHTASLILAAKTLVGERHADQSEVAYRAACENLPKLPPRFGAFLLLYLSGLSWSEAKQESIRHTASAAGRSMRSFEQVLQWGTFWPYQHSLFARPPSEAPGRVQSVRRASRHDGLWSSKMRRHVMCDSSTERDFFRKLERLPYVMWYQEQPESIQYQFKGSSRRYTPDARIIYSDGRSVLVEVKQGNELGLYTNVAKWTAMAAACEQRGFGVYIGDQSSSLRDVIERDAAAALEQALLSRISKAPVTWSDYKQLRAECDGSRGDLPAIVLRHRLVLSLRPFCVRAASAAEEKLYEAFEHWYRVIVPVDRDELADRRRQSSSTATVRRSEVPSLGFQEQRQI